jgi:hypothetical protein
MTMYFAPVSFFTFALPASWSQCAMTDEKDLHVAELEAQLLDARADHRHVGFEIAVDEDVALGRRDQIARQPFAADVVEVSGNSERRERLRPIGGAAMTPLLVREHSKRRGHQVRRFEEAV